MGRVIAVEAVEQIILDYIVLRWQLVHGQISKLWREVEIRAQALGLSGRTAMRYVRWGRKIGMVDTRAWEDVWNRI